MTQSDINDIVLLILKIAGIITVAFNLGIALVLARQIITMNNVVRVKGGMFILAMVMFFVMIGIVSLLYVVFI